MTAYDSFVFIHIEKCAGTFVKNLLYEEVKKHYSDTQIYIPGITCPEEKQIVFLSQEECKHVRQAGIFCVADHSHFGIPENKLALSNPFRSTLLRDPIARILSHYYFFSYFFEYNQKGLDELNADELNHFLQSGIINLATLKLAGNLTWNDNIKHNEKQYLLEASLKRAKINIHAIQVVGFLNKLPEFIELLNNCNPFGFRFDKNRANIVKNNNRSISEHPVTEAILKKIRHHAHYDIELYNFAQKEYANRVNLKIS